MISVLFLGDIDTFVKIPRPDNRTDMLGLTVLDEPTTQPSNPAVVKLGLAYQTKSSHKPSEFVESIDDAGKRTTLIDKWISDISNLHKKKPAPTVHYTQHMPDVEQLLQVGAVCAVPMWGFVGVFHRWGIADGCFSRILYLCAL